MGNLRRGPGGPAEWRVGKLRQAALRGAQEVLEDELVVGLQPISQHCSFLVGRGARPFGHPSHSGSWEEKWSDWWSSEILDDAEVGGQIRTLPLVMCQEPMRVPEAIDTLSGFQVAPAADELVRLEGHHWATRWAKGRGSVYRLDQFGRRGEGLLVPEFCALQPLESGMSIQMGPEIVTDVSCLAERLRTLAQSVNRSKKMPVKDLITQLQHWDFITLHIPVTSVACAAPASYEAFSRAAARRWPLYIESVEMGARLQISVVPLLNTRSGEPDCLDVEELEKLGAQLFPLSNLQGLLCVRRLGGPSLHIAALGQRLEDICDYLTLGWVDSLFAAPKTWARLSVGVKASAELEASLGHFPGRGVFTKQIHEKQCGCGKPAVGSELLEDTLETIPMCRDCGSFVKGSEAFFAKQGLAQHTSRPHEELIGSFDSQLDDTLKAAVDATAAMTSWASETVPEDMAVLCAAGLLSLKPPKKGWPEDVRSEVHQQLQMVIGCPGEALHITTTSTEADTPNLMVAFVLIHPAVLNAGRVGRLINEKESLDPQIPLLWYQRLETSLKRLAENQGVRSQWTKTVEDKAVPLLFISDKQRVVLPCSLFLLKNDGPWERPRSSRSSNGRRASSIPGTVGQAIDLIRDRVAPKDGIDRGRRQSLDVQRQKSHSARRATVAELASSEKMEGLEEAGKSLMRRLSEDASRRQSLAQASAQLQHTAAAKTQEDGDPSSGDGSSSASSSSAEAEDNVPETPGGAAEPMASPQRMAADEEAEAPDDLVTAVSATAFAAFGDSEAAERPEPEDPVVAAVLRFQPSLQQLALRLRDLVAESAWNQQADRVEHLLNRWAAPDTAAQAIVGRDAADLAGQSALDLSVKACNYPVTQVLLKHLPVSLDEELVGLLNQQNPVTGHSLLYAAVRYSNRHTAFVVDALLKRRADVNAAGSSRGEGVLVSCVRRADLTLIQRILAHRASLNVTADDGKSLLQTAVSRGDVSILSCLLKTPSCDVNMLDGHQRSALVSALQQDRRPFPLIHLLLEAKCSATSVDIDGMQPLCHAVGLGDQQIYRCLLLNKADPNAIAVPATDKHARMLYHAAKARDETMIACLLEAEADPNLKAKDDRSVLHLAIALRLSEETVQLIIDKRADPDAVTGLRAGGETALRMAVLSDHPAAVKLLLCARADPSICNLAGSALGASLGIGPARPALSGAAGPAPVRGAQGPQGPQREGRPRGSWQSEVTHPMHLASTWRKAKWRPRVGRPTFIQPQEVKDFDPLFPFNLPPICKKFRETR